MSFTAFSPRMPPAIENAVPTISEHQGPPAIPIVAPISPNASAPAHLPAAIEFRKSNVSKCYPNGDGSSDARMNERNLSWERQTRRLLA